jgi:hypothetical protein
MRFLLESILPLLFAYWGWHQFNGVTGYVMAAALPVITAAIWGIFRVNRDPVRLLLPYRAGSDCSMKWCYLPWQLTFFSSCNS